MAGEQNDSYMQSAIVDSLRNIERLADVIREDELSVRHTFLQDDMARFISTVSRARMSAEGSSPRYAEAARVTGACAFKQRALPFSVLAIKSANYQQPTSIFRSWHSMCNTMLVG